MCAPLVGCVWSTLIIHFPFTKSTICTNTCILPIAWTQIKWGHSTVIYDNNTLLIHDNNLQCTPTKLTRYQPSEFLYFSWNFPELLRGEDSVVCFMYLIASLPDHLLRNVKLWACKMMYFVHYMIVVWWWFIQNLIQT